MSHWHLSHRYDQEARELADRHYNRRKVGSPQFAPPGRLLVLKTQPADAFWITSWPFGEYVRHEWPGAWVCSAFRNEGTRLSSDLIREAVAITVWKWGAPDAHGMLTFVNAAKVRAKRDPGRCFIRAGFEVVGKSKRDGLVALLLPTAALPAPLVPHGAQLEVPHVA